MSLIVNIDAAVAANMQHGAMACADAFTEALYAQMDMAAAEGAQPAVAYPQGLTVEQRIALANAETEGDTWVYYLAPLVVVAVLCLSALYPWGVA